MMKRLILISTLLGALSVGMKTYSQDFSNKGKDFWVAYGYHQQMTNTSVAGGTQDMRLYFSAEQATNVTVSIPGLGYSQNYTVPANSTIASNPIPKTGAQDSRLLNESTTPENKGIHITSDKPIVAYAHIYNGSVSGATILFPTVTLGREYYSVNYTNISNSTNSNCWFYVIAADTGTTTVRITPSQQTINHVANAPFNVDLTQGQVFNIMGTYSGSSGVDLTGSKIESINTGSGCKKIAVFSGSGRISITCNGSSSSSDNYMVQAFPKTAWGKKFLTVPSVEYNTPNGNTTSPSAPNIYRICVSDPTTVVRINGVVTTLPLINNFYYDIAASTNLYLIEADKPVVVAQYFPSRGACGLTSPANGDGDPETIYLSPVEQNINKVLWNANAQAAINQNKHFINVVIPNSGTAISSFTLDGVSVPASNFLPHPQDANFSYAKLNVTSTPGGGTNVGLSHIIQSDSGFNAMAYGYGNAESYGYNAGTNIKDLSRQIGFSFPEAQEVSNYGCHNTPFKFKVAFPATLAITSMTWNFNGTPMTPNNSNVLVSSPVIDSTTLVNGKLLNWYSLPTQYTVTNPGNYTILITITVATPDACGNEQEYDFPITISENPVAAFSFPDIGCVAESVQFTETTPQVPKPTYKFWWEFKNTGTGVITNSNIRNPNITFAAPGTYQVRFANITTPGCLSDTATQTVVVPDIPDATITDNATVCINATPEPQITFTATGGAAPYTFTYNINAGPNQTISTSGSNTSVTINAPTNIAGTFRYTLTEVKNSGSAVCVRPKNIFVDVVVNANVALSLTSGSNAQSVCQNIAIGNITYTIGGGGDNATATGLPAGVTGVYNSASKTFVISGVPTTPGTYNYTVTATGSCLPSDLTGTITVNPDASIALTSANSSQTVCINTPVSSILYSITGGGTGGTVTGLPAGVTGSYSGGVFTISGSPTVSGTFNYTVNTTGTCVQKSESGTITINPDATLSLTSAPPTPNQSLCINTALSDITYSIGGGGSGGTVTGLPPGVTGAYNAGVFTISGSPTVVGTYPFTVTTTGICVQKTLTGTITVNPDAAIALTSAPPTNAQELCRNSTLTSITYSITGGGTGGTVSGLPAGVTGAYSGGVFTISGTPSVDGTFNYTVTTTGTCVQKTATGTIIVNPLPTVDFNFTSPACATRTIAFQDLSAPNVGTLTSWNWNFNDAPANSTLQNPAHIFNTPGTYVVELTVTNSKGCTIPAPVTKNVVIKPRPQAGFIVPEVCINDLATVFTDTSHITGDTFDPNGYEWNFGDPGSGAANVSNVMNGSHLYTAIGPYNVMHVATTTSGCKDTTYNTIFINAADPVSDFNITLPSALCSNDSISLVNRSTISQGSVTRLEIYWDVAGAPATFETVDVPVFNGVYKHKYPTLQTTQTYTIRMIAYSGNICFSQRTTTVTVHAAPRVQFLAMSDVCFDATPFQITQASETGGVPGSFTFSGPGVSAAGIFNPSSVAPGNTYTIKYMWSSTAAGCKDSATQTITVIDTATARFNWQPVVCEKGPTAFNSTTSSIPASAGNIVSWVWNFGDPGSGATNTSAVQNPSHDYMQWGTYNITLQVISDRGCRSTVRTMPVFVNPVPRPGFSIPASACLPSANVTFSNSSTIPDNTQAMFSYLWNFGDPASGALNSATGSSPSHIYNAVGPYSVNLQVTSGAGCPHDTTIVLNTIHPQPLADFNVDKTEVCIGDGFVFTDNTNPMDGVTTSWAWNLDDGNTRTVRTFPYTYSVAGTYDVELYTINSHGCRSTTFTGPVTVHPYPVVDAGPDRFVLEGGQVTLEPVVTGNDLTYLWTPNNSYIIGSNTVKNLVVKGVDDIRYLLTVTARGGCTDTSSVFIKVLKNPGVPNIFSPNGDGVHDKWVISYLETYPGCTVDIYNRYGQLIFHSVGYQVPWDGKVNGRDVPVGTYYYIVNPKNGRSIMSGYVDVIR